MASSRFKKFISGKNFIYLGALLLLIMLVVVIRQFAQRYSVQTEIRDLSAQARSISQKNQDLQNLISYLKTPDFQQRAARQQLNLQKSGEQVYSFAPQSQPGENAASQSALPSLTASQDLTANTQNQDIKNPQKWWNYFFKSR